ncbi:M48 family metallopeptidase [Caulobacter sp. 73W]|uniref:M48 family metallopeptidase n=1 Tax=Caulobacter sp. 73W TaxID=3161137 RepID=A0AB39KSR8_9CAUL
MKRCIVALASAALLGCATPVTDGPEVSIDARNEEIRRQQEYVLAVRTQESARFYKVAHRIAAANAELCRRRAVSIGATFETIYDYAAQMRSAAKAVRGVSSSPQVEWLDDKGPAALAGLRMGDVLLAVNGTPIDKGPKAGKSARGMLAATLHGPQRLMILRNGETVNLDIVGKQVCGYPMYLVDDPMVNASADSNVIRYNRGMLRFTENDDEVALILGHELAHNVMQHIQKSQLNRAVGAIGGALLDAALGGDGSLTEVGASLGDAAFSQAFEAEADYVGLYFAARAGYGANEPEKLWRRMSTMDPSRIRKGSSHPPNAARYVNLAATQREIAEKKEAGQPLVPRLKKDAAL